MTSRVDIVRSAKCASVTALVAIAIWEFGAARARDDARAIAEQYTSTGRLLIVGGALVGGVLFSFAPPYAQDPKFKRYLRWVGVVAATMTPSSVYDLFSEPWLSTLIAFLVVSFGFALTTWFVEDRLLRD